MRTWIPEAFAVGALALAACSEASAQTSATLTERTVNAITKQEPTWKLTEPFGPLGGGSIEQNSHGRWEYPDGVLLTFTNVTQLAKDDRITLLIQAGVDVNAKDYQGRTALEIVQFNAAHYPGSDVSGVIRTLVAAGAK